MVKELLLQIGTIAIYNLRCFESTLSHNKADLLSCHIWLIGWLYFTSHRQQGHLERAPLFNVPCKGHETLFLHSSHCMGIKPRAIVWQSITLPLRHDKTLFEDKYLIIFLQFVDDYSMFIF